MEGVVVLIIKITITYMLPLSSPSFYIILSLERLQSPQGRGRQSPQGETPVLSGETLVPSREGPFFCSGKCILLLRRVAFSTQASGIKYARFNWSIVSAYGIDR